MRTHKTKRKSGFSNAAVPSGEFNTQQHCSNVSPYAEEEVTSCCQTTKTPYRVLGLGLVIIAAACVAAAVLWHRIYGVYRDPTTLVLQVSAYVLLGMAALTAFFVGIACTIATARTVETRKTLGEIAERARIYSDQSGSRTCCQSQEHNTTEGFYHSLAPYTATNKASSNWIVGEEVRGSNADNDNVVPTTVFDEAVAQPQMSLQLATCCVARTEAQEKGWSPDVVHSR